MQKTQNKRWNMTKRQHLFCLKLHFETYITEHQLIKAFSSLLLGDTCSHFSIYSTWGTKLHQATPQHSSPLDQTWQRCKLVIRSPAAPLSRSLPSLRLLYSETGNQSCWMPSNPFWSRQSSIPSGGWRDLSSLRHHSPPRPAAHLDQVGNHAGAWMWGWLCFWWL